MVSMIPVALLAYLALGLFGASGISVNKDTTCTAAPIKKGYPLRSVLNANAGEAWLALANEISEEAETYRLDDTDNDLIKLRAYSSKMVESLNLMAKVLQMERPFVYDVEEKLHPEDFLRERRAKIPFKPGKPKRVKYPPTRPQNKVKYPPKGPKKVPQGPRRPNTKRNPTLPRKPFKPPVITDRWHSRSITKYPREAKYLPRGAQIGTRIGVDVVARNPTKFDTLMKWSKSSGKWIGRTVRDSAVNVGTTVAGFYAYDALMKYVHGSEEEQASQSALGVINNLPEDEKTSILQGTNIQGSEATVDELIHVGRLDMVSIIDMGNEIEKSIEKSIQLMSEANRGYLSYYAVDASMWEELKQIDGVSPNWIPGPMEGANVEYDAYRDQIIVSVPSEC